MGKLSWLWKDLFSNSVFTILGSLGVATVIAFFVATWGMLTSPASPQLFVTCLGAFAVTLFITNEILVRRLRKKLERGELTPPPLLRTIEELQSAKKTLREKLATIERRRPHLTAEIIPLQEKIPSGHTTLINEVSFVFLCIRNEPPNHNLRAIAYSLSAKISFCDEKWNPLCPPVRGVWRFSENLVVKHIRALKPQDTAYLYLAMKTYREESCYTLDALHADSKEWCQSQQQLTNQTIYIKVVLTCHLYQTTYHYMLTNEKGKETLECKEIPSPEKTHVPRETVSPVTSHVET